MDVVCEQCQSRFRIPDEKIPAGRAVTLPCPKCRNRIPINPAAPADEPIDPPPKNQGAFDEVFSSAYNASDKPFDFVEEDTQTALVCEDDPAVRQAIVEALNLLEFEITMAENVRDALKKMRYHTFEVVVVNEKFNAESAESNPVLLYLERMKMATRRNIFITMVSDRFRTMDHMTALQRSVNIILNTKNIGEFDKILKRGLTDNDFFYRMFKSVVNH